MVLSLMSPMLCRHAIAPLLSSKRKSATTLLHRTLLGAQRRALLGWQQHVKKIKWLTQIVKAAILQRYIEQTFVRWRGWARHERDLHERLARCLAIRACKVVFKVNLIKTFPLH